MLAMSGFAVVALLGSGAHAAPTTVKDVTGDANAINDQGLCFAPPACGPNDTATPGSQAGFDIVSLTFGSTFKGKTPTALVVTLEYAGKPDETSTVHRVTAEDAAGCSTFLIQYYAEPTGNSSSLRTCGDPASPTALSLDIDLPMPKVDGNKLVWTIPYTLLKGLPSPLKPGGVLSGLGAHNRLAHAVTAPVIDNVTSEATYKLGA